MLGESCDAADKAGEGARMVPGVTGSIDSGETDKGMSGRARLSMLGNC